MFTCNQCDTTLKKDLVISHYQTTCKKKSKVLTCTECNEDLKLEECAAHTNCTSKTEEVQESDEDVSEGENTQETDKVEPKGENKQESWMKMLRIIVEEQKDKEIPNFKGIFDIIRMRENIPKVRNKYVKYMMHVSDNKLNVAHVKSSWRIIENCKRKMNPNKTKKKNKKSKTNKGKGNNTTGNPNSKKRTLKDGPTETPEKKQKLDDAETPEGNVVLNNE